MNKKSMLSVLVIVLVLLVVGVGVTAAQGNGQGGNGGGNGGNGTCLNSVNCTGSGPVAGTQGGRGNRGNGMGMGNGMNNGSGMGMGNANGMGMNNGSGMGNGTCLGLGGGLCAGLPAAYAGELPQATIDLMVAGWQDEQTAYALYGGMVAQFGNIRPFTNIQRAEAQHIAAWEFLFDRYGIDTPAIPTVSVPTFADTANACQAGVDAETANYALYDQMLANFKDYPDLSQVAQNLRDASEFRHLPIFQSCAG